MAFDELKQRHAAMWGAGPFERIALTLTGMHEALIEAVAAQPGERWLDIGSGTGELAFRATRTGAEIVGADLAPSLVATAVRRAAESGHDVRFEVADCEALPYDDGSFDVVTSSVGAIFAPDHGRVASELGRVLRPGGRLALSAWTMGGDITEMFGIINRYSPPPTPGAGGPVDWGDPAYCERLLGDRFELAFSHHDAPWDGASGEELWNELSGAFGPIVVLLRMLDDARAQAFRDEMVGLFSRLVTDDGVSMPRPFLLVQGTRRA